MKSYKNIMYIIILILLGYLYDKFNIYNQQVNDNKHYDIVKKYLLKDSSLAKSKLPILWIHIDKNLNAREWHSFYSRSSNKLNQPYKLLTIKSIIDKCGDDFNICIIDDSTFNNLIPGWITNLELVADPIKTKLRDLALAKLLFNYGGFIIPPSFLCLKNLKTLYNNSIQNNKIGVGEMINYSETAVDNIFTLSQSFICSEKNNITIEKYINYMTELISTDYTAESIFTGSQQNWFEKQFKLDNTINIISAENLGAIDNHSNIITIERLAGNIFIELSDSAYGVYIPDIDILNKLKYQWIAKLSIEEVLNSDTNIGKFILYSQNS